MKGSKLGNDENA